MFKKTNYYIDLLIVLLVARLIELRWQFRCFLVKLKNVIN